MMIVEQVLSLRSISSDLCIHFFICQKITDMIIIAKGNSAKDMSLAQKSLSGGRPLKTASISKQSIEMILSGNAAMRA